MKSAAAALCYLPWRDISFVTRKFKLLTVWLLCSGEIVAGIAFRIKWIETSAENRCNGFMWSVYFIASGV